MYSVRSQNNCRPKGEIDRDWKRHRWSLGVLVPFLMSADSTSILSLIASNCAQNTFNNICSFLRAWVAIHLSVQLWLRSWSHGLWLRAPHQVLCWQLRAWRLLRSCGSLSGPPLLTRCLSLSKINKYEKNNICPFECILYFSNLILIWVQTPKSHPFFSTVSSKHLKNMYFKSS